MPTVQIGGHAYAVVRRIDGWPGAEAAVCPCPSQMHPPVDAPSCCPQHRTSSGIGYPQPGPAAGIRKANLNASYPATNEHLQDLLHAHNTSTLSHDFHSSQETRWAPPRSRKVNVQDERTYGVLGQAHDPARSIGLPTAPRAARLPYRYGPISLGCKPLCPPKPVLADLSIAAFRPVLPREPLVHQMLAMNAVRPLRKPAPSLASRPRQMVSPRLHLAGHRSSRPVDHHGLRHTRTASA